MQAAEAFSLTPRAIANAKSDESPNKNFSELSLPSTPRDKLTAQRGLLDSYFAQIQPVSGLCSSINAKQSFSD